MTLRHLILAAISSVIACAASAQQLPNGTDLKAMYCIPVLQADVQTGELVDSALQQSGMATEEVLRNSARVTEEARERLVRVQRYIVPRVPHLDPNALLAARAQGDADQAKFASLSSACAKTCTTMECLSTCTPDDLRSRRISCRKQDWLPF